MGGSVPRETLEESLRGGLNKRKASKPQKGLDVKKQKEDYEDEWEDYELLEETKTNVLDERMSKKILDVVGAQQKECLDNRLTSIIDDSYEDEPEKRSSLCEATLENDGEYVTIKDQFLTSLLHDLSDGNRLSAEAIVARNHQHTGKKASKQTTTTPRNEAERSVFSFVRTKEKKEEEPLSRVEAVYKQVGLFMSRYRSGKIPKAFKIIPRLQDWEHIMMLTEPLSWSPAAMYQATKIFASNFNPKMVQRFYSLVLVPAVREDIESNRKLNYHYYEALIKGLFKPAAWLKGVLLPMMMDGCSLREIVILGSVMSKTSVPVLHAGATLMRLCDIEPWDNTVCYIILILINKKYNLPSKVIRRLLTHFDTFTEEPLPLIWHKCLLALVQKYKNALSEDDVEVLKRVMKRHPHHLITAEIRVELDGADTEFTRRFRAEIAGNRMQVEVSRA